MREEQKAKAYDEALAKAKEMMDNSCSSETTRAVCQELFPVLSESEYGRNWKMVHKAIRGFITNPIEADELLDWLEKQIKQKPVEWSEEDKNALNFFYELISFGYNREFFDAQTAADMREWLNTKIKSFRHSWKPSEEQMEALESAVKLYKDTHYEIFHERIVSLYEELKKL